MGVLIEKPPVGLEQMDLYMQMLGFEQGWEGVWIEGLLFELEWPDLYIQ